MLPLEKRNLERVRYWQGQKLRSRDFNRLHASEDQRRWWHNRALHNAYGVHEGFSVTYESSAGTIEVDAGLAYDDGGRELILEENQVVHIPDVRTDQSLVLLVRYREQICGAEVPDQGAVVCTGSAPQFVEFVWRRKEPCRSADGVVLAEVQFSKKTRRFIEVTPHVVEPLSQPLLASGATVPGNTAWEPWVSGLDRGEFPRVIGVQTTIDTSAAGFRDQQCYFAWLQGPVWSPQTHQIAPALYPSIAEEALTSFVFRLAFPAEQFAVARSLAIHVQGPSLVTPQEFPLFARRQKLYVNWIGCQPNASVSFLPILRRMPLLGLNLGRLESILTRLNRL